MPEDVIGLDQMIYKAWGFKGIPIPTAKQHTWTSTCLSVAVIPDFWHSRVAISSLGSTSRTGGQWGSTGGRTMLSLHGVNADRTQ